MSRMVEKMNDLSADVVFPLGNEKELAEMGRNLGFEKLFFIYSNLNQVKGIKDEGIGIDYGVLVLEKNKKILIKKINKIKKKGYLVLVKAGDDNFNRFVLEKTKADMIFGLEKVHPKDAMHYRRSGLDQVLCRTAASKNKKILFDFGEIFEPMFLGRIIQNMRFCRKFGVDFLLASMAKVPEEMKGERDLRSLEKVLQQKFL